MTPNDLFKLIQSSICLNNLGNKEDCWAFWSGDKLNYYASRLLSLLAPLHLIPETTFDVFEDPLQMRQPILINCHLIDLGC